MSAFTTMRRLMPNRPVTDAEARSIAERNRRAMPPYSWAEIVAATVAQYDRAAALRSTPESGTRSS